MNQNEIKLRQNQAHPFEVEEMDANLKELDDRTKHSDPQLNSIQLLAEKVIGVLLELKEKEDSFLKNTAFNKDFGSTSGTVVEGDDDRVNNGQAAYNWGDHAEAGYSTQTLEGGVFIKIVDNKINFTNIPMPLPTLEQGTNSGGRIISAKVLNDWLIGKNYITALDISNKVDKPLLLTAGTGLNGGGTLEANRSFSVDFGDVAGKVVQGNDSRLLEAFAKKVNAISVTGDTNKIITVTREDGTTLTASFLDNNDPQYPDDVINFLEFNMNNDGVLVAVTSLGEIISVSLDGRYSLLGHTHKISDITGLQALLDSKSTQTLEAGSQITIVDNKINVSLPTHSLSDLETGRNLSRLINGATINQWLNGKNYVPDVEEDEIAYVRLNKNWVSLESIVSVPNLQRVTDVDSVTSNDVTSKDEAVSNDSAMIYGPSGLFHGVVSSGVDGYFVRVHKDGFTVKRLQDADSFEILFPAQFPEENNSFIALSVNGVVADDKGNVKLPAIKGADFNITGSQYVPFWSGTAWTNNGLKADFTPTIGSLALRDSNASVQTATAVSSNHAVNFKQIKDITIPRVIFLEEDTYITMNNNPAMETIIIIGGDSSASEIYIYGDVLNEGKKVKVVNYTLNSFGFNTNSFDVIKNGIPVDEIKPQLTYNFIVANQDNQAYLLLIGIENLE